LNSRNHQVGEGAVAVKPPPCDTAHGERMYNNMPINRTQGNS